ncbi:MAG: sensor domain-containing diguanylate cyclase [Halomonadaceae bacterium]|nr:MAG: sensor domain-containing diguanylate cyclase [Halomonadaceae bacterium]
MLQFRKLRIKYKLMLVVILTTSLGLLISVAGVIAFDRVKQREILVEEMTILTQVIGARSAAALSFMDQASARENLSYLLLRDSITSACIHDRNGDIFAKVDAGRAGESAFCPESPGEPGAQFSSRYLDVVEPIRLNNQSIGYLTVRTDLSDLGARLRGQVVANVGILVLSLIAALAITSRLQQAFYRPIVALGQTAHLVTHEGNYGVRASTDNEDELGEAVAAFNTMLGRIEQDQEKLTNMAYFDTLTELPNRRRFSEELEQAIGKAARTGKRVALIFVDLDKFKQVNDTLGHDVGDLFLQSCADRLRAAMPVGGMAYRLAGDEFTVMLEGVRFISEAEDTAKQIFQQFAGQFVWPGGTLNMSVSLGIALSNDGDTVGSLLKKADMALYQAKDAGRNNYQIFREK